ncbi:MAG: VOC family protein [Deltaproteobacteria bacterium]|nr:VOC family protein [Myxococcales bacterium]MDP3215236.1 VOC family protein [Deltaproteobacteria bacterium]
MKVHEMFAYLRVKGAAQAIAFYVEAFGAVEKMRLTEPGGRIGHAELLLDGHEFMLSEEFPEMGILGPASVGGTTLTMHVHVDDCDAAIARAVAAGATLVRPPQDHFYGERSGTIRDPFGHEWNFGHSIEKVTNEEMQRRYTAMMTGG